MIQSIQKLITQLILICDLHVLYCISAVKNARIYYMTSNYIFL
jgi:hypothetical protein